MVTLYLVVVLVTCLNIHSVTQQWYAQSFIELCAFEGLRGDRDDLKDYVNTLAVIAKRHVNAVQTMAQGVIELSESHDVDSTTENSIQYFLDRFYMSRISTKVLTSQHQGRSSVASFAASILKTFAVFLLFTSVRASDAGHWQAFLLGKFLK